jgi:hypothetical protein
MSKMPYSDSAPGSLITERPATIIVYDFDRRKNDLVVSGNDLSAGGV